MLGPFPPRRLGGAFSLKGRSARYRVAFVVIGAEDAEAAMAASLRAGGGSDFPGEQSSRYGKLKLNSGLIR
jgi:hypothetical protein